MSEKQRRFFVVRQPVETPAPQPAAKPPPPAAAPIASILESPDSFLYQPETLPQAARAKVQRADGRRYEPGNPKRPVYENRPNHYDKKWLDETIALEQQLADDEMYQFYVLVAGHLDRSVEDILENPLARAKPDVTRIGDLAERAAAAAAGPAGPGQPRPPPAFAWAPADYSATTLLRRLAPNYLALYNAAAQRDPPDRAEMNTQLVAGIRDYYRSRLALPADASDADLTASMRGQLVQDQAEIQRIESLDPISVTDRDVGVLVAIKQRIAELQAGIDGQLPPNKYEDLPGFAILERAFNNENRGQDLREVLDAWDTMFGRSRLASQRAALIQARAGAQPGPPGQPGPLPFVPTTPWSKPPGELGNNVPPPANLEWLAQPRNLQVIKPRPSIRAALGLATGAVCNFSKRAIDAEDLMTGRLVRESFALLVALYVRSAEVRTHRRNDTNALIESVLTERRQYLLMFAGCRYLPGTNELYISGVHSGEQLISLRKNARRKKGASLKQQDLPRAYPTNNGNSSDDEDIGGPGVDVYSPLSEDLAPLQLRTGQEVAEWKRGREAHLLGT